MAKKRTNKPKQIDYKDVKFVLNNLDDPELEDLDQNPPTHQDIWEWLAGMIENDWKISMRWDYYSGAYQIVCTQLNADKPNAGYAFSGRSDDLQDAVAIAWYKYVKIAQGTLDQFYVDRSNIRG